jgi:predicted Zn-ribbon and HTH transcriptional regulator
MNERSLENLRIPKVKKEGHGYRYSLPQNKIDELFGLLAADGMTLKKAAKSCGICWETAKKYFKEGDIKRGIKPLQWRLTVFQDRIHEKFNVLVEERRMELLKTVRDSLSVIKNNINPKPCKACSETGFQQDNTGIKQICPVCKGECKIISNIMLKSSLRDLERLTRLEVFLLGGVTQKEHERKFMSAEEMSGGDTGEGEKN